VQIDQADEVKEGVKELEGLVNGGKLRPGEVQVGRILLFIARLWLFDQGFAACSV
jgi:hypothetical protein